MKKATLFVAVLAFAAMSFTSCKKCSTCKYTWDAGGTTSTYTYPEVCGKKSEVETYEKNAKAAATLVDGTVTCDN